MEPALAGLFLSISCAKFHAHKKDLFGLMFYGDSHGQLLAPSDVAVNPSPTAQ